MVEARAGILRSLAVLPSIWMLIALALLSAFMLGLAFSPWGIGVVHDSFFYLSGADNLSAGRGLVWNSGGEEFRPLVHFPPGYSTVLAVLGGSHLLAASVLQIAAIAATVILIGGLILLGSGSRSMAVLGATVAAASPILFERYLDVRTEPIFLVLLLGSLTSLLRYLQTDDERWLWGAGVLTGLAGVFRYAGLAVLGSGILAVVILHRGAWIERAGKTIKYALIPTTTMGLLAIRNIVVSGTATNRVFSYHPPGADVFRQALVSLSEWILPASVDPLIRLIVLATFIGVAALLAYLKNGGSQLLTLLAIYAMAYAASLLLSLTFFDASIRLDNRILVPVYLYSLVGAFTVLGRVRAPRVPIAAALIAILTVYAFRTASIVSTTRSSGRGFASRAWRTSPTIELLDQAAPSGAVYSNEAQAIYSLLGISAIPAPERTDPVKGDVRAEYKSQLAEMQLGLMASESALVLFHPDQLRDGMPTLQELTEGLVLTIRTADAALYVDPSSNSWP